MAHRCPLGQIPAMVMVVAALAVCRLPASAEPGKGPVRYAGQRLAEALTSLQAQGLRIVFSSEIVTADMRVAVEPRAKDARSALDELLAPHGLVAKEGPGQVIQVVRGKRPAPRVVPEVDRPPAQTRRQAPSAHREHVMVTATGTGTEPDAVSVSRLRQGDVQGVAGVLADDPIRAVQTLAGAAPGDDFRSELSIRGSSYRHVGVVVEGVTTNWLRHAAYGRGTTESVTMVGSDALERATLEIGAHAQRNGGHLGAELGLTLREGSREAAAFRAAVTTTLATLVGEGPIGRARRGSWLAAVRNSHVGWPIRPADIRTGTVLGFTDVQSKLVFDVSAAQQMTVSVLTGRSSVDELDEQQQALGDGANRVALATLGWRSMVGSRTAVSQRVSVVTHGFDNQTQTERALDGGTARAFAYRADLTRGLAGGLIEAGTQVQRVERRAAPLHDMTWLRSAYANVMWAPASRLKVSSGLSVAHSSAATRPAISPWILTEWSVRPSWSLRASTGQSHQFPGTEPLDPGQRAHTGDPERATHVDAGITHLVTPHMRWHATWFSRAETNVLREDDGMPWHDWTAAASPSDSAVRQDRLTGSSRGVELRFERQSATGLSGWAAYSYGRTRYTDAARQETFWGDFDQRHAVNVATMYRVARHTMLAATFRGGSGLPLGLSRPAQVRLPPYARLDVRFSRAFHAAGRRMTLFVDVVNVLNRTNLGRATGPSPRDTGEVMGRTERLLPRFPSAGLAVEF